MENSPACHENKRKKTVRIRLESRDKIRYKDITLLCKKMGILLESGCEITKILSILGQQSSKSVGKVIAKIYNHIQNGNSIATSFQFTQSFSQFFVSMVRAGEISGNLDRVMDDLSRYYDKEYKLRSKTINALIYPSILLILCTISTTFMLMFVIPNFQMVFESNGVNPPIITKIVINISILVRRYFPYIIGSAGILILVLVYYIKTSNKLKQFISLISLKLPILKDVIRLIVTTRFSKSLQLLLHSGIQIIDALDISARIIDNSFIYKKLEKSNENIKQGNSIGSSLVLADVFPSLFIEMINIGEESGKLDLSLATINKFYESELDNTMDKIVKLIEPVIIVIMGVIVGVCIIAMVVPMFSVVSAI